MPSPPQEQIIFYDLPSRPPCRSWSMNPWKIRLFLNYKSLPYTTEWTEYPDIAPKFKAYNIPPNPKDVNPIVEYSIPTIRLPDGRFIMDSIKIAEELDKLYPDPPLHVDSPLTARAKQAVTTAFRPLFAVATLRVPHMTLNTGYKRNGEEDFDYTEWFVSTRETIVGMPRTEFAKFGIETVWPQVLEGLEGVQALLKEDEGGPMVMGNEVSFADLIIASMWVCMERLDQDGDLYGRIIGVDKRFAAHHEACKRWMVRDDH